MALPLRVVFQPSIGDTFLSYDIRVPSTEQTADIPKTYLDAQFVRETVFVNEQKAIPVKYNQDRDDIRSYHWILYSPSSKPIGTVRLIPPPHQLHPAPGQKFEVPDQEPPGWSTEMVFNMPLPEWAVDRRTDLHDGIESYIKLGRLCVVKEERGKGLADSLIRAALEWAKENRELAKGEAVEWKGLVCVHAQVAAVRVWERAGFVVDEGMGQWFEAGIRHFGMFKRIDLES